MSKKNKLKTRQAARANDIEREKAQQAKKDEKAAKVASNTHTVQGVQKLRKGKVKRQRRGIRLKKGAVVKGVKIKDAESRQQAMQLLQDAMENKMELSDAEWEEMTAEQVAAEGQTAAAMQQG